MYREPVNNKQQVLLRSKTSRYGFSSLLEVTNVRTLLYKLTSSVRVFFAAKRRKMYREPVNEKQPVLLRSKTSRYGFLNLLEVTNVRTLLYKLTSSVRVFFAAKRRKMYREPVNEKQPVLLRSKTSRYGFLNLLEVTNVRTLLYKLTSSVRVFFAAKRRKMYREPVNEKQPVLLRSKTSRYGFLNLLEVTNVRTLLYKLTSSVRVFFAAKRRKMYREPVNEKQPVLLRSKTSRYGFLNLLEVTNVRTLLYKIRQFECFSQQSGEKCIENR